MKHQRYRIARGEVAAAERHRRLRPARWKFTVQPRDQAVATRVAEEHDVVVLQIFAGYILVVLHTNVTTEILGVDPVEVLQLAQRRLICRGVPRRTSGPHTEK